MEYPPARGRASTAIWCQMRSGFLPHAGARRCVCSVVRRSGDTPLSRRAVTGTPRTVVSNGTSRFSSIDVTCSDAP